MNKVKQWLGDIFAPEEFNDVDIFQVADALNDSDLRKRWFLAMLEEIKRVNKEVDRRLLGPDPKPITDLAARRKAFQDMLELVLSVKRQLRPDVRSNPSRVNLDVTAYK